MFRKISFLIFLPFIASCSLIGSQPENFIDMYTARVKYTIESIRDIGKVLGYMESYKMDGMIRGALSIPGLLSGSMSSDYSGKTDGKNSENIFRNIQLEYTSILGESQKMRADEIELITQGGDVFFKFSGLSGASLFAPEAMPIIEKYEKKWLSVYQSELENSGSGLDTEKITRAISSLSLDEIQDYLIRYPIWKEVQDLGVEGGIHTFEVVLHKENVVNMVKEFTKKATGKDMKDEDIQSLEEDLKKIEIRGKMSFDPRNPKISKWDGVIMEGTGTSTKIDIQSEQTEKGMSLKLKSDVGDMSVKYDRGDNENTLEIGVRQGNEEVAKLNGKISKKGGKISRVDMILEAPSQGLTVRFEHMIDGDSFEGKVDAGVGNLMWKGKGNILEGKLSELKISGAMIGSNILLDLKDSGNGMMKGPLTVKTGGETVIDAEVMMKINREEFICTIDIKNPEDPTYITRAEIEMRGKRASWNGTIKAPSGTESFKKFIDEIDSLVKKNFPVIENTEDITNDELYTPMNR